ncbi:MAG TPA: hypothetical protein VKP30_29045 [Polyangiaceae bacterium]|nr:hypothetical protein [Polyangiaceae bacterium]
MQSTLRVGFTCSLLSLVCACGGTAPTPQSAASKAPAPVQQVPAAPDLSPVSAPGGLIGVGRIARPLEFTKTVAGWASLPFEPRMIDGILPGLSQAVSFDAPLEFALVLPDSARIEDIQPEFVASIGLASVERARALLEEHIGNKLIERSPSVFVTPEGSRVDCAIAASVGKATSRLVCADKPASLEHLLPYATRGLPLENLGSADLHAELRVDPLRQRYATALRMGRTVVVPRILKEISLGDARIDRPLAEIVRAFGDELLDVFDDTDRVVLELGAASKPEQLNLKLTMGFRAQASLVSKVVLDARGRMIPPNAQFFDLPLDSTMAGYAAAVDPKLAERPRALITGLVDGFLEHLDVSAAIRTDTKQSLNTLLGYPSTVAFAFGTPASDKAKPAVVSPMSLAMGWRVYGVEAPAAPYRDALKALVKLGSDQKFRKGLDALGEQSTPAKSDDAASTKKRPAVSKDAHRRPSEWFKLKSRVVAKMPAGSEVALIELSPDATKTIRKQVLQQKRGKQTGIAEGEVLTFLFAVVPDGNRTWIVMAVDDKTLAERAQALVATSTAARLSTRADLAPMRGQSAYQAGFATLQLAKGWLGLAMAQKGKQMKDVESLLATLPHQGTTPVFYRVIASGDEKQHSLEISTSVPRAVFDDVAAAVPAFMMLFP